uniref:Reverse transcriptase domain-containing protein n=1 Tax=Trichuris muris TaxID=70415 RepID=A0A5S6QKQ7_TRIMR
MKMSSKLMLRVYPMMLRYVKYVLPKNPRDFTFKETVDTLTKIFAPQSSLFNVRYQCLRLSKNPNDNIIAYTGMVNEHCGHFRLKEFSEEQFRRFIFVRGLQSPGVADFRIRLLRVIERDTKLNVHDLAEEYQRLKSLKHDGRLVENYPLPLPEGILAALNGGQYLSKIDLTDAYLQVEVDEESKELLTTNTHRGLWRYDRLPLGVKSAPAIFQQIMDTMLSGVKGAVAYLDDAIVVGRTEQVHRNNLDAVFKRIEEFGFRLRAEQCILFLPNVKCLGFVVVGRSGRRPDRGKLSAITRMSAPSVQASLRSFLGLVNCYWHHRT